MIIFKYLKFVLPCFFNKKNVFWYFKKITVVDKLFLKNVFQKKKKLDKLFENIFYLVFVKSL